MPAKVAPPISAPSSDTSVRISAIDTTLWLVGVDYRLLWNPPIKGFERVKCGTWSFLIEHPSGRKLLYDLGCCKDWQKLPPDLGLEALMQNGTLSALEIEKNVSEILTEGGINVEEIEGVIWSHWYASVYDVKFNITQSELTFDRHFDHTGDPSTSHQVPN